MSGIWHSKGCQCSRSYRGYVCLTASVPAGGHCESLWEPENKLTESKWHMWKLDQWCDTVLWLLGNFKVGFRLECAACSWDCLPLPFLWRRVIWHRLTKLCCSYSNQCGRTKWVGKGDICVTYCLLVNKALNYVSVWMTNICPFWEYVGTGQICPSFQPFYFLTAKIQIHEQCAVAFCWTRLSLTLFHQIKIHMHNLFPLFKYANITNSWLH